MATISFSAITFVILISLHQGSAQPNFLSFSCGTVNGGNDAASKTYTKNVNTLLLSISSNAEIDYGFYNFSYGKNENKVNAIALCRGDVNPQDCRFCNTNARGLLYQLCPNQKEAIGWYDNCLLRYSNRSIFRTVETAPYFYLANTENALQADKFKQVLAELMRSLRITAASGDSRRKYAAGNAKGPSNQTIYGLVQCTPDLSSNECDGCLSGAISEIPKCCDNRRGGRVVRPSCSIRYEIYSFFQAAAPAP